MPREFYFCLQPSFLYFHILFFCSSARALFISQCSVIFFSISFSFSLFLFISHSAYCIRNSLFIDHVWPRSTLCLHIFFSVVCVWLHPLFILIFFFSAETINIEVLSWPNLRVTALLYRVNSCAAEDSHAECALSK